MDDKLGKEYEEWLDEVEKTLPLPIPEEEQMSYTKSMAIENIYRRLAILESDREESRIMGLDVVPIDEEMRALRLKLQEVINSSCPILSEVQDKK